MLPGPAFEALKFGHRHPLESWLKAENSDVNSYRVNGQSLLGICLLLASASRHKNEARRHLEVGRMLVSRGARADWLGRAHVLLDSPLVMPITSLNIAGTEEMYAWYDLLIAAGADPNASSKVLVDGFWCRMSMLSRVCFLFPATALITSEKRLELIKILLRAGANPCACDTTYRPPPEFVPRIRLEALRSPLDEAEDLQALSLDSAKSVYDATWALEDAVARAPELVDDEHYVAAKRLIKGVIAAGSYKKYLRLPLQELLNLLSLAQRGKLATTDPVMKSLVGVDNHVVWNVSTYWVES